MDENCSISLNVDCLESPSIKEEVIESELISDKDFPEGNFLIQMNNKDGTERDTGIKLVECSLCFKYLKETSLRQHMKTHTGLKPYQCSICKSKFTRKGDVTRHAATMHSTKSPKYKCDSCNKWFIDTLLFIAHLKTHEKQTYYSCSICLFKFSKKEYYADHVKYGNCKKSESIEINNICDNEFLKLLPNEEQPEDLCTDNSQSISMNNKKAENNFGNILKCSNSVVFNNSNDGAIDSSSIFNMKLSPIKINNSHSVCNDSEHVIKAIKTAVLQSEEVIKNIQQTLGSNMTTLQSSIKKPLREHARSSKNLFTELQIKASIDGKIQTCSICLPSWITFDTTTPTGMKAVMNIVSNLCKEKGKIEGEIDVKVIKSLS